MKIAVLEPLGLSKEALETYLAPLKEAGHTVTAYFDKAADTAEFIRRTADNDIIVIANTPYPKEAVLAAPSLKLIDVAFTGVDHVPLETCREKGVRVVNAAGYSTSAVAELALGMAVACLRKFPQGNAAVNNGGTSTGLMGTEIAGKTVGILGTGTIGIYAAKLFLAFGAEVIAYSRTEREEAKKLGIRYVSLEELFKESDIVSVHVPSNKETKKLVSRRLIESMKKSAVLINTARGVVVDNEALAEALRAGDLAAAGIDVFDTEPPLSADYCLVNCPNLVPMPHVGFLTAESMQRRAKIVFENIEAYLKGEPQNICV